MLPVLGPCSATGFYPKPSFCSFCFEQSLTKLPRLALNSLSARLDLNLRVFPTSTSQKASTKASGQRAQPKKGLRELCFRLHSAALLASLPSFQRARYSASQARHLAGKSRKCSTMPVDSALGFCPYPTKQSGFTEPGKGAEAEEDRATLGR